MADNSPQAAHQPLLGRLAARWFNEVIATDALRLLLDDKTLRRAFLTVIEDATSVELSEVTAFERERSAADGRLDLEGVDRQGRPRLIVEAKFGHTMSAQQIGKYRVHQRAELGPDLDGALVLLVPDSRLREAEGVAAFLRASGEQSHTGSARISPVAMSWGDALNALSGATADDAGPASPAADIAQLRAVCETLSAWSRPPSDVPEIEREDYFREIVDRLKDRIPAKTLRSLQSRDPDYLVFRYYHVRGTTGTVFAVGLTSALQSDGATTPFWLRFHKRTGEFAQVKKRLRRSGVAEQIREHRGHIWFPLVANPDFPAPELIDALVVQVAVIMNAAAPLADYQGVAESEKPEP